MANEKDTVPGLGFKDKEKALETLEQLKGRDSDYQKLAIKGLIGRAKRVLQVTKAEDKVANIKEATEIFEKWLKDFEKLHVPNWAYLPLATIELFTPWQKHWKISDKSCSAFQKAYKDCGGEYKKLRTVASDQDKLTWDIVRNNELRVLLKEIDDDDLELWDEELPTKIHTQLIMWAYSPDASKIKKQLSSLQKKLESLGISDDNDAEEIDGKKDKNTKRKLEENTSSSSEDDDESPKKKK